MHDLDQLPEMRPVLMSVLFLAFFVLCVAGLYAFACRPEWDGSTDVGMLWSLRVGVVMCPVAAIISPLVA